VVPSSSTITSAERSKSSRQRKSKEKRNSVIDGVSSGGYSSKIQSINEGINLDRRLIDKSKS